MKLGHKEEFYRADEGRILGSEEFVEQTQNRIGEIPRGARHQAKPRSQLEGERLMRAAERVTGIEKQELCSGKKTRALVLIKEAVIILGRELGASNADLGRLLGLDASVVSRRHESGMVKMNESQEARRLLKQLRADLANKE
jgi:hypothetical protein